MIFAIAAFFAGGLLLLPVLGLQFDEVMFSHEFWQPRSAVWRIGRLPLMMMSYLGSLKTWVYAPLLALAPGNVWVIRVPALAFAAATLWFSGKLLTRINGRAAGAVVVLLLATDNTFQLTAVFDWGPVVLQNLLLVLGSLLLFDWSRDPAPAKAWWAGFLFGLGLWNKALFIWDLSGLGIAAMLLAWPQVKRLWRVRSARRFWIGLLIGAAPLVAYNVGKLGGTLRQNGHFSLHEVPQKAVYLMRALDGQEAPLALISAADIKPDAIGRPFEEWILSHPEMLPVQASSWRLLPCVGLILVGLVLGSGYERRWIAFCLLSGVIGWLESAITQDAGGSIHHTVLFWIPWYGAVAIGAGCLLRWRRAGVPQMTASLILLLCVLGMRGQAVTYANLLRYPAKAQWRDADGPLLAALRNGHVRRAFTTDWGIANLISTESRNAIVPKEEAFGLSIGRFEARDFATCRAPECVLVTHVDEDIFFPASAKTLADGLSRESLQVTQREVVSDTHGVPTFEVLAIAARQD